MAVDASRWRTLAAGALSGVLFALAFPPFGWVVLLPLALTPWLVALAFEPSPTRALLSGVVFAFAYWGLSIPWIAYVVTVYGGQSRLMGAVSVGLAAAILSPPFALVGWGTAGIASPGRAARFAAFPLLWVGGEHLRTVFAAGFPWNLTAHALYRHPVWLQSACVWGAYGVGAAVAAVSALLAHAAVTRRVRPIAIAAALVLALGVFGTLRLARPREVRPTLSVALLQPNLTEEDRSTSRRRIDGYFAVLAQLDEAARRGAELLVVPESTLPIHWQGSDRLRSDLGAIAARGSMILFNDFEEESEERYFNVARLLDRKGLAGPPYRKVHLVPFGEYVPLPQVFFFVRRISRAIGEFTPAPGPVLLRSGPVAIGVGVCYEIIYPSLARQEVADGANLLATVSNDSWYGRGGAQAQHFAGALLRSVETERALVRAAITGVSGIVDARGRILAESRPDEKVTLFGTVRLETAMTVWTRWGYRLPVVADAAGLAVLLFGLVRAGRGRAPRMTHDPETSA